METPNYTLILLLFTFLAMTIFQPTETYNKYCESYCGSAHVLCWREPCAIGRSCGPKYDYIPLQEDERLKITNLHNKMRSLIATHGGRFFLTNVSNMCALSYSKELEYISQCIVNSCTVESYDESCKDAEGHKSVSHNTHFIIAKRAKKYTLQRFLEISINTWFSKRHEMSTSVVDSYINPAGNYMKAFITLTWAKTTHVGCGRIFSYTIGLVLVCSYAPSRSKNMGSSIIKRGPSCSECDECVGGDHCNAKWPGLCGSIRDPNDDNFKPPFKMFESHGLKNNWCTLTFLTYFTIVIMI